MDWTGILVGILVGALLGVILGLQVGSGATKSRGGAPLPTPPREGDGYVTKADLEQIELRLEDAYDKLHHLYDRTRKRLKVTDEPPPPAVAPPQPRNIREIKAAIRARLAARRGGS